MAAAQIGRELDECHRRHAEDAEHFNPEPVHRF